MLDLKKVSITYIFAMAVFADTTQYRSIDGETAGIIQKDDLGYTTKHLGVQWWEYFHELKYGMLKTLDTIGSCQRPVFSIGVSKHMHKITNLWKFELNWWSKLRDNNEQKKTPNVTRSCVLLDGLFRDLKF